ncbi:unnamed protein product [Adineta steineri]|uniref:Uncharacterized protein n=1 Tax=Adineta steineri TaxID=433720 RepID=A0A819NQZ4_9BILA|nr:unnamed protein product [Adineta steineri]
MTQNNHPELVIGDQGIVKENIRVVILINEINNNLYLGYPLIFHNIILIYWQHWNTETFLDKNTSEDTAHLLASVHLLIRRANQNHTQKLPHNNHTFTKFVEKFVKQINEKSPNNHENHYDVKRLFDQIQYQHKTSTKLKKELQQEKTVLTARVKV